MSVKKEHKERKKRHLRLSKRDTTSTSSVESQRISADKGEGTGKVKSERR